MSEAQVTVIKSVEVPLDEYKAFIEWKIKGPTVEIPLEEYDRLREENRALEGRLMEAERYIEQLRHEIENRKDLDEQTDVVARMVADEMAEKIIKRIAGKEVSRADESRVEIPRKAIPHKVEREGKDNGRI